MFFFLSKTIYFIVMPLSLVITILFFSLFIRNKVLKKRLRVIAVALLIFYSNPYFANKAMNAWEGDPTPLAEVNHDIGIVLTGVTNRNKRPLDRVYFEHGADRILHALQLYKMGKINKILISGGSGKLTNNENDIKEADELAKVLLLSGVPQKDILIERVSRNTYESAINCAKIINDLQIKNVLLITSAFHLTRAGLCFKKQNINFTPFGTDYYSYDEFENFMEKISPNSNAVNNWKIITKESAGIVVYKLMGYI
ncbi:MAG: YdcF family protein [Cyclobacteriaceae bacterium]|nr:YdcF family protein [Cyclobacteriaceae bacterium]